MQQEEIVAAYFVEYLCPHCGITHEVHSYIFTDDVTLAGEAISEVYFEDQFLRYRESIRCSETGKSVESRIDQFILRPAPNRQ